MNPDKTTHFGFREVPEQEKAARVGEVFSSVASNYDRMNDLMSLGMHRLWKRFAVSLSGVRAGDRVLDVASGSGDLALAFAKLAGESGQVWMTDINGAMLAVGRDKLLDHGLFAPLAVCDAEKLPFPSDTFDCVSVAFGLRNMTHKDKALAEMTRVARPGGRVLILEFSKVWKPLARPYDAYSFSILPWLGRHVAKDEAAYRYLAESIRMHPDQEALKAMMEAAGLVKVDYYNLTAGVVALHKGYKP
jgi:demethylmenaquinone methyltransferase / 2-methoxy-6-polyprenyl-1,4-benzoquinol methylase